MAFAPLQIRGNLEASEDGGTTWVDVSDEIIGYTHKAMADNVEIAATLGKKMSFGGGNDSYETEVKYLVDTDAASFAQMLWDNIGGKIMLRGTFREGDADATTNPEYTATAVVSGTGRGGDVNTISEDSQTFKLTGKPVKTPAA